METHAADVPLAFAGTLAGVLAFVLAALGGDAGPALAAFAMATYCGAEFLSRLRV